MARQRLAHWSLRRGLAGSRQRWWGPPRPPSPGNGRLEIGPQAEPRENGCGGQSPAEARGRGRRVDPERSRGTRGRVQTVSRRVASCLRSRTCLPDTARLPPTRGRCRTLRTHAQPRGKRPQPTPCSLALHPKPSNCAMETKQPTDTTILTTWGLTLS